MGPMPEAGGRSRGVALPALGIAAVVSVALFGWLAPGPGFAAAPGADGNSVVSHELGGRGLQPGFRAAPPAATGGAPGRAAPSTQGTLGGDACRFLAAALGLFACAAARQSRERAAQVVRRVVPYMTHKDKQKVLRRFEPHGAIPAWSKKPLLKKRVVEEWRKRPIKRLTPYGRQMAERKRIQCHYNINNTRLTRYVRMGLKKGHQFPFDIALQLCESRLANFVWRVGLARTCGEARYKVVRNNIEIKRPEWDEWEICDAPGARLRPGTQVRASKRVELHWNKMKELSEAENAKIPAHISWDKEELTGSYNDVCSRQDFGLYIDESILSLYYSGKVGCKRDHGEWMPGTSQPIPKWKKGKIRPTPTNILNMRKGRGLVKIGRRKPPCSWGRRWPVNSRYFALRPPA